MRELPGWLKFTACAAPVMRTTVTWLGTVQGDLAYAVVAGQQRVAVAEHGEGGHGHLDAAARAPGTASSREQPQGVDRPEPQVVGTATFAIRGLSRTASTRELAHRAGQRLVVHPAGRRDEHDALDPVAAAVGELDADGHPMELPTSTAFSMPSSSKIAHHRVGEAGIDSGRWGFWLLP